MPTTFRPYEPDQIPLLPPHGRDWAPDETSAHHLSDLVDSLDLSAFYARYEGDGRRNAPYEPSMMVKVLNYGYATGVFSSRKIRMTPGYRCSDRTAGAAATKTGSRARKACEVQTPREIQRCSREQRMRYPCDQAATTAAVPGLSSTSRSRVSLVSTG